jgi:tetratricopeptide (TPR) repeat protein
MADISPLFAVEAEQLLMAGQIEEAIELCRKGLEDYPDYPAALSVLSRAYITSGNAGEAGKIFSRAKKMFSGNKAVLREPEPVETAPESTPETHEPAAEKPEDKNPAAEEPTEEPEVSEENEELSESYYEESVAIDEPVPEEDYGDLMEQYIEKDTVLDEAYHTDEAEDDADDLDIYSGPGGESAEEPGEAEAEEPSSEEETETRDVGESSEKTGRDFLSSINIEKGGEEKELKATNLDLIPGLNFLSSENLRRRRPKSHYRPLPDAPEPGIESKRPPSRYSSPFDISSGGDKELDALAGRIENARIERVEEDPADDYPEQEDDSMPSVVTETYAGILESQGATEKAIEAYEKLAEMNPEKSDHYQGKINRLEETLGGE